MENSSNIPTPDSVINKEKPTDFTYLNSPINKEQMLSVEPVVKMIQQKAITKQRIKSSGGGVSDISFSSVNNRDVDKRIKTFDSSTPFNDVYKQLSDGEIVKKYDTFMPGIDNNERLAQSQSTSDKWINGLTKATLNFGTTVVGNTVGFVGSVANGIAHGSLNAVTDNSFTNYIADLNEKVGYQLPNYVSKDEQDDNFGESLFNANFWAKDVAGAFSFTLGTAVSEAIWAVATGGASIAPRMALRASKAAAVVKAALKAETYAAGIGGAKSILASATKKMITSSFDDVLQAGVTASGKGKFWNTARFLATTSGNEASIEALHFKRESRENFYDNFERLNGRKPDQDEINEFEDNLGNSANAVFATNLAILAPSNFAMFGSAFNIASPFKGMAKGANKALFGIGTELVEEGGEKVFKGIVASGKQKAARYAYAGLKPIVTEGLWEEGLQGVTTKVAKHWIESSYDPKYNNQTISLADATYKSFAEQYGTKEGWKEIGIGGIVGGVSSVVSGRGKFQEVVDFNRQQEYQDKVVAGGKNKYGDNTTQATRNMAQQFFFNSRVLSANERRAEAAKNGDDIGFALANQDTLVSEIQYRKGIGEDPKELISKYETALNSMPKEEYERLGITDIEGYNSAMMAGYKSLIASHEKASEFADAILGDTGIMGIDSKTMETQQLKDGLTRAIVSGQLANKAMDSILQDMGDVIGKDKVKAKDIEFKMSQMGENTRIKMKTLNTSIEQADKERVILSDELQKLQLSKDEAKGERLAKVQTKLTENLDKTAELKSQREELARDISQESKRRRGINEAKVGTDKVNLLNDHITGEDLANLDNNLQKIEDTIKSYEGVNHEVYYDLLESKRQYGLAKDRFLGYQDAIDGIVSGNFKPNYAKVSPFWQKIFMQKQGIDDFSKTYLENIYNNFKDFGSRIGVDDVTSGREISENDYRIFQETEDVSDEIKQNIADVIKDKGSLSKRQKEIYDANYDEINDLNKVKPNPNKPDLSPEASINKEIEALEKEKAELEKQVSTESKSNNVEYAFRLKTGDTFIYLDEGGFPKTYTVKEKVDGIQTTEKIMTEDGRTIINPFLLHKDRSKVKTWKVNKTTQAETTSTTSNQSEIESKRDSVTSNAAVVEGSGGVGGDVKINISNGVDLSKQNLKYGRSELKSEGGVNYGLQRIVEGKDKASVGEGNRFNGKPDYVFQLAPNDTTTQLSRTDGLESATTIKTGIPLTETEQKAVNIAFELPNKERTTELENISKQIAKRLQQERVKQSLKETTSTTNDNNEIEAKKADIEKTQPQNNNKETQEKINKINKKIEALKIKKRGTLTEAEKVRQDAEVIMERDFPLIPYNIDELIKERPTKTEIERYKELYDKKDNLDLFESKEFEELQSRMQKWFTAESLPSIGGMSLADVVEYLGQLETVSEKENTLTEAPFESILGVEDAVELVNENILQNRAGSATVKIINDKIFFSGLNIRTIIDRLVENGITQAEIKVVVKDKDGKEKLLKKDLTDALLKEHTEKLTVGTEFLIGNTKIVIGARGNIVMDLAEYNKIKNVINVHHYNSQTGSWSWSDTYEELPNGDKVKIDSTYDSNTNSDAMYDSVVGDDVEFYVDMNTVYNIELKSDALVEIAENDKISDGLKDSIHKNLEITARRNGKSISTMKATGDKVTNDNFMLVRKRYADEFIRILEEEQALATLPKKIDLKIEAPISEMFLGTPNFILDENNKPQELPITEAGLTKVLSQGYVQDKEIVLADKKIDVDKVTRLYVSNLAKKNPGMKIPVVLLQKGEYLFVFPIKLIQTPSSQEDKFQTILESSDNFSEIRRDINNLLISLGTNTRLTSESQIEAIREELANYKTTISADDLVNEKYDKANLIADAEIKIDLENMLISSPKMTVDFSKAIFGTKTENETNAGNIRQEIVKDLLEIEKIVKDSPDLKDETRFVEAFSNNAVKDKGSDIMNRSDVNFIMKAFFNESGKIAINANDKAVIAIGKDKLLAFRKKLEVLAWHEDQIKVHNDKEAIDKTKCKK